MSQPASQPEDVEGGKTKAHDRLDPHWQSTPLYRESNFGDSSGPLFSIYSKAADDEDNKMAERWQKDADGILIFTGLFSAAVAALLSFTLQFLIPNSQDTSAFYLGNIYEVLADPNATRAPIPFPVSKPPQFSPPRFAIWVNSLWFLSLVISLTCALLATSLHQWSRRYIRVAQMAQCSPERRARMRAFFAEGASKMHIPWTVEGLPALLHLSVFLFFGGLVILLFNIDHAVFSSVIWWIGLFSIVYGLITVMPIIRHDSPYYSPLSQCVWFLYTGMKSDHRWMSHGVERAAEETALKRSSEINIRIFNWTIDALGDDDGLEKFFEAVPGFFTSNLVKDLKRDLPKDILDNFWNVLNGFMGRTLSSNSVLESVKSRRVNICKDIMNMIPHTINPSFDYLSRLDQAPAPIERLQAMARWATHNDYYVANRARTRIVKNLARIQERDDDWIALARKVCVDYFRDNIALGDSVLLTTLIHVSGRVVRHRDLFLVRALTQFDICNTLLRLRLDFCNLWNELVQEARNRDRILTIPVRILREIRLLYITLHQGTRAAPTAFSSSTQFYDVILSFPSSYPLCDITSHHPDSTTPLPLPLSNFRAVLPLPTRPADSPDASPRHSASGGSIVSRQVENASVIPEPLLQPDQTTSSEIGDSSQVPTPASPVRTSPHPKDASPPGAVADILPTTTLSHPPEGTMQRDIVAPCAELGISEKLIITSIPAPTLTLTPAPTSTPVLNGSLASCDAGAASAPNPLLPASPIIGFSTPSSLHSRVPTLFNAEFLGLCSPTPFHPTGNPSFPRLHVRGLVNTGSMCFVNAVLQLLVHSPPFWNMFSELGDLERRRGAGCPETNGGATPLVSATARFFEKFRFREEPPLTQQPPQRAAAGKPREDEGAKKKYDIVDSFELSFMYDAMKEKGRLKTLLDDQWQDAGEFFRLYLEALDEEFFALLASNSGHKSATASPGVEERGVAHSGQADVGKRGLMASSAESPISLIFGGKSRSTVRAPKQPDAITVELWRSLQLNLQPDSVHTIQELLVNISKPQPSQVDQSSSIEASRQVLFETLPPVLVLHLKRFLYDASANDIVKTSRPVQFAPELEIPPENMTSVSGKPAEPAHYRLYGVLYHHGDSIVSGHYTVYVLHQNRDSSGSKAWLHIDNEAVSTVRHEDVFGAHDNERGDGRCVHMLFYCRTNPHECDM